MIQIEKLKKVFKTTQGSLHAVDGVNLKVDEGTIFGIIGYSGAGKSTLIRLLNGLERPTSGDIFVAGRNMRKVQGDELRKARQEISMIFQHFNLLWSRTVRENILFPLEVAKVRTDEKEKRVSELIKLVGLDGREDAYPSQLSGGQKQRVGIARALANNPKVLLCDEATSALDPKTTDSILELLTDINEKLGLTIILITHEMHVIHKICDQVAVMEEGKFVEQGNVIEVFQQPKKDITKHFVKQVMDPGGTSSTPEELAALHPKGAIVRIDYVGKDGEGQLLPLLIRAYPEVDISIVQGNIAKAEEGTYGHLLLHIAEDNEDTRNDMYSFLSEKHVQFEVMQS
ncbi:methionine ABC transporter ATP-binding protein [Aureibacillus halotolerans]|uniref:D-methionine transport system ATP-binding protein n=1 Tax=Aureibacillus halotolerans TaxID=1508390 RepID=A0A4R6U6G5_9BACI|nr:methionine ABC transporter ATP-binding protein [Aureibacillus halotolerans]TDQ40463.1 D-methionine transport system ATP-binding protein [Aureibacillus halotolerans]